MRVVPRDRISGEWLKEPWTLRSDGVWVWSNAVAHYVRRHHFRVPVDFVMHMAGRNWVPPARGEVDWAKGGAGV